MQEFDASARMLADIWKRFIAGDLLDGRENYGLTSQKEFGISMKTQELNLENIPCIEVKPAVFDGEDSVCNQIMRRVLCGKVGRAAFVALPEMVNHEQGRFLFQPQEILDAFLSDSITMSRLYSRYIRKIDKAYTDEEALRLLHNPIEIDLHLAADQLWLAKRLRAT